MVLNQGFHVIASSCDMARTNQTLAKSLGVTAEEPYFQNPSRPNSHIYWFYDVSHLIKLVRNHLLDQGFFLRGIVIYERSIDSTHLWQYGLWSFQMGGTKLDRFLPQRKLLNFENWISGGLRSFQKLDF